MADDKGNGVRTMEEFSRFVGVSRPTVSKYFNDPKTVRESTRHRIESAIEELNFRPNMLAINFKKQRTNFIGVVIPDAADPFYASLVQNMIRNARSQGFITVMLTSDGDLGQEEDVISTLVSLKVAGLILVPSGSERSASDYEALVDGTPIVFVDSRVEGVKHFVGTDNTKSVSKLVNYLNRTGTPPCFFPMPAVNANANSRTSAYCLAMEKSNLTPQVVQIEQCRTWDFEDFAFEQTMTILAGQGFPTTTVLCANDRLAYGVMAAAHASGLRVGNDSSCDLRIAGHDDHPFAKFLNPQLTTVRQDVPCISKEAIGLLLSLIERGPIGKDTNILCDTEVEMRGSA